MWCYVTAYVILGGAEVDTVVGQQAAGGTQLEAQREAITGVPGTGASTFAREAAARSPVRSQRIARALTIHTLEYRIVLRDGSEVFGWC
jgi:hypothetical protein